MLERIRKQIDEEGTILRQDLYDLLMCYEALEDEVTWLRDTYAVWVRMMATAQEWGSLARFGSG